MSDLALRNLSVLSYANGFTLWYYKATNQTIADVLADGFFSQAEDMLAAGDMIHVSNADGAMTLHIGRETRATVLAATSLPPRAQVAALIGSDAP